MARPALPARTTSPPPSHRCCAPAPRGCRSSCAAWWSCSPGAATSSPPRAASAWLGRSRRWTSSPRRTSWTSCAPTSATLPAPDRELLAVASVLGKEFSSAIARALAGGDELEVEERFQRLCRVNRVLENRGEEDLPDGTLGTRYRFAHGLYQRVLYEDLVAPRRAELHRRAGERLLRCWGEDAPTRAVEMAEHFERGRDIARAVRFRTLAGEHAARRFAGAEAVDHYTRRPRARPQAAPRTSCGRSRWRSTAAAPRPGCCSRASTTRRATTRRCSSGRAPRGLAGRRVRGAQRPVQRPLLRAAHDRDDGARPRGAAGRRAPRLAAPPGGGARPRRAGARDGRPAEGGGARARRRDRRRAARAARSRRSRSASSTAASCTTGRASTRRARRAWPRRSWSARSAATASRPSPSACSWALARANQGRMSEALADFEHAEVFAARNGDRFWQPRLVSQQGWVHRELAAVEQGAGARRARARARAREPLALDPRGRRAHEPVRRRRARRRPRGSRRTCSRPSKTAPARATGSAG